MALDILKKGLKVLENRVKAKKETLQAQLAKRKPISQEDEQWLDHNANLVDEQRILEALENASDYERGLERLDEEQKGVVRRLQEAAGNLSTVVGKKRKRTSNSCSVWLELTDFRPGTKMRTKKDGWHRTGQGTDSFYKKGKRNAGTAHRRLGLVPRQWAKPVQNRETL
jgi:hypothetical protein